MRHITKSITHSGTDTTRAKSQDGGGNLNLSRDGNIFWNNKRVGYVTPEGELFGIGRDSYAVRICAIDHAREAIPALREWWNTKR